jgi:hypothetical protein
MQVRFFRVGLGADRHIFASGHRHGAGNQASHARYQYIAAYSFCRRNTKYQARRGNYAVVGAQYGGTQPAAAMGKMHFFLVSSRQWSFLLKPALFAQYKNHQQFIQMLAAAVAAKILAATEFLPTHPVWPATHR